MKIREAFELTLALCRRTAGATMTSAQLAPLTHAGERTAFHGYAMRHGVLGLVLTALRARAGQSVDAATLAAILSPLRTLSQQARLWDMERDRVLTLLHRDGLEPLLLKGGALRLTTYADSVERPVGDLDLLAPGADMEQVVTRLQAAGYRMPESPDVVEGFRQHHFHLPMNHPNGFEVELHWALTPAVGPWRLDHGDFIARAVTITHGGGSARVPAPEQMVLHLSAQNTEDHFSRLRRFVDLDRLIARHEIDWDLVVSEARRGGLEAPVALSLQLARGLLGTPLPPNLTRRLGVGRATRSGLALLTPISGIARLQGPRRALGASLQEVWLASGASRMQHLKRLLAGAEDPLAWVWRGDTHPRAAAPARAGGLQLAASLALYQCGLALSAPLTMGTAAGRRDLGVWARDG